MYTQVGEFRISWIISTVPLTRFLRNAVFSRNQNARNVGNRCTYPLYTSKKSSSSSNKSAAPCAVQRIQLKANSFCWTLHKIAICKTHYRWLHLQLLLWLYSQELLHSILVPASALNQSFKSMVVNLTTMLYCDWFSTLAGIGIQTKCFQLSGIFMSLSIKKLEHPNLSKYVCERVMFAKKIGMMLPSC